MSPNVQESESAYTTKALSWFLPHGWNAYQVNFVLRGLHLTVLQMTTPWPHISNQIGIYKCWFFAKGEKQENLVKHPSRRTRTNNKLNAHMTMGLGLKPGPDWEASTLATALPCQP